LDFIVFASQQWVLFSILLLFIYAYVWRESSKSGKSLSHFELTRMLNDDSAVVLDVRDAKEYTVGHIAGALNIPYTKLADRSAELSMHKEKVIVVVDKQGQHAGAVGRELGKKGYTVNRLGGGMSSWIAEKLPMVKN